MIKHIGGRKPSLFVFVSVFALAGSAMAQEAPILLPGAPGTVAKELSADDAIKIADTSYTADDVKFMQDMIPHHWQAVEMANLVAARTNRKEVIDAATRITASQDDEIKFMRDWLIERGEEAPDPAAHKGHGDHKMNGDHAMMGMATPEQMTLLAAAEGVEFDRMFLKLMIVHHEGAIKMVDKLLDLPGSAYDPVLFEFISDVKSDQRAEIKRMNEVLVGLSVDPRANLAAGYDNAGEAIRNLTLVAAKKKPAGFFDPANPSGIAPEKPKKGEDKKVADSRDAEDDQSNEDTELGSRSPLLSFAQTDMAFSGDTLVVGNYHGFNVYQLEGDAEPKLLSSVVCPGGQGDVSIVGDLLIMSVEQTRGRVDCGLQGVDQDVSAERFRGLRIFDISDRARPVQVGQVQTCRGSHTHSVVSGPGRDGKIIVYNSGTAGVRKSEELAGCVGGDLGDNRTALFRIDVIEIPVADPSKARIIDSPAVFADPKTGAVAGLWTGGDHGEGTQDTSVTDQCHDITVFPAKKIAAGACSGNGIIFDISNPRKPKRIDVVTDTGFAYWHSATFNNDGTKVIFTDEWGGGSRPRCRPADPKTWGADAIYDIVDGKLEFRSYFKIAAPQTDSENCVAHNGSAVPVPGRDLFVQSWYQGGLSIIDFTDSANPVEIAYFDRGPIHAKHLVLGGYWSSYWYDGRIYATEIARGLDIFELAPSEFLSENEIEAARLADVDGVFNPQQQFPASWPAAPAVARAYADQLVRSGAMTSADAKALNDLLDRKASASDLKAFASSLAGKGADATARARFAGIADVLSKMAASK